MGIAGLQCCHVSRRELFLLKSSKNVTYPSLTHLEDMSLYKEVLGSLNQIVVQLSWPQLKIFE